MHKIQIEPLPDLTGSPSERVFQHFLSADQPCLFSSGESDHGNANYDIIVANPIAKVEQSFDGEVRVIKNNAAEVVDLDLFTCSQHLLSELLQAPQNADRAFPFQVGALGFAGYDVGRSLELLPSIAEHDYQAPIASVGIYAWSLLKHKSSGQFYLCYSSRYGRPQLPQKLTLAEAAITPFELRSDWHSNMTKASYLHKFQAIQDYLSAGDSYQVNLAQRFSAEFVGDPWQAYCALLKANHSPFSAFLKGKGFCVASCSPERFFEVRDNRVETKPIKGTRPRVADPVQNQAMITELQHSEKDQAENLMIVDLLRNDLSKNCTAHSVKVDKLFDIESFAAVHHLVSTVSGQLKPGVSPMQLLKGAFPGGSITGAPKIRAMEVIEELEPHTRHIYCGSVFYLGINGDLDSNICIRTLLFEQQKVHCWAGGGIVADSVGEMEYQETLDKVNKILPVLSNLKAQTGA